MNKTAIKNFSIWARNKLIDDIKYRAGLVGVTEDGIQSALPQSAGDTEFYDIGTGSPYAISGDAVKQRQRLAEVIRAKERDTDYKTAYKYIVEEVAYTWFNRLIAVRFMEVNDYLPSHIRVLSSDSGKLEPDLVTTPFQSDLCYSPEEEQTILRLKQDNEIDELFRLLFIKQCNALNELLPGLFEKTSDYTELLLSVSVVDTDGVVYHLVHDIPEDDFNVEKGGQVEIIGWLYQYWNTEPKDAVFSRPSGQKIKKEEIPAATQLFTPDWIVRYMVENSLGRLWVDRRKDEGVFADGRDPDEMTWQEIEAKRIANEAYIAHEMMGWKYYLPEAEQTPEVRDKLNEIQAEYANLSPVDIKAIDPCMGSGHILCYLFDVLMQIYESQGWSQRDAAQSILKNNLYGLDIDDRAYQLAYFAVMMKARQYDRRILSRGIQPHVYAIVESNGFNKAHLKYFGDGMDEFSRNNAINQINGLLEQLHDAKEYGSILPVEQMDWDLLRRFASSIRAEGQMNLDSLGMEESQEQLKRLIDVGEALAQKYQAIVTNPPYMGSSGMSGKLSDYVKKNYPDSKSDLFAVFIERCGQLAGENCYQAMITQHAWMFLSSFEKLREKLQTVDTINMAHLGARAFDEINGEVVQTTSFVMRKSHTPGYTGTYQRLIDGMSEAEKAAMFCEGTHCYTAQQENFSKIPGAPVAYWINKNWFCIFDSYPALRDYATLKKGTSTGDNARFIRNWYEVDITTIFFSATTPEEAESSNMKWFPINGGGERRKWFGNRTDVVNWKNNGSEMKALATKLNHGGHWSRYIINPDRFFTEAIGWSAISSSKISVRYIGFGFAFSSAAMEAFDNNLKYVMALVNSVVAEDILHLLAPTINFGVEQIGKIPVVIGKKETIEKLADECINTAKNDWDSFETSWDFKYHPIVRKAMSRVHWNDDGNETIEYVYKFVAQDFESRFQKLKANEEELNRIFIDIYGLQGELTPEVEDKDVTVRRADLQRDIKSLISYAVGCMFGRYSLNVDGLAYAGGVWDASKYRTFLPDADNILPITDEEYFDDDIVGLFCAWLKKVFGPTTLEQNLDFIAEALGNKGDTSREVIRSYFLNDFFKDHCQTYSVTGSGKRPIYWLFDSGRQNGFKALVYLHRYTPDTIGNLRIDYLHRMQRIYESEMNRMQDTIEHSKNPREVAAATKRKEKLQRQLKECREYDEKISHLALSRIELDLDDGVKVNYRKVQTARDGKFYEVLADSKNIMAKK